MPTDQSGEQTGTVKWFDEEKGHGFITRDTGGDIFVHYSRIQARAGRRDLTKGQRVSFTIITLMGGRRQAGQVKIISS